MCRSTILAIFTLAVFCPTVAVPAFAQVSLSERPTVVGPPTGVADEFADLRDLADEFAEKLANHTAKKVIVTDFEEASPDGLESWPEPRGTQLADQFSDALSKSGLSMTVLDRRRYRRTFKDLTPGYDNSLAEADPLSIGRTVGADTVVEGSYVFLGGKLHLTVSAFRVRGMVECIAVGVGMFASGSMFYPPARIEPDFPQSDDKGDRNQRLAEPRNFSDPECISCPMPSFRVDGPADEIRGVVLLAATISTDGRATNIKVLKSLTPERDRQAIRAVENWTFKPAMKVPGGIAFAMQVPIEVQFKPD